MPFRNATVLGFNQATVNRLREVGGVYGLAKGHPFKPGWSTILYVGKTGNLRERVQFWLNNPPVAGITHFFADVVLNEAERTQHEIALITQFKPVGNTLHK
jgi:excinuclease UvrABC nuclease subunit